MTERPSCICGHSAWDHQPVAPLGLLPRADGSIVMVRGRCDHSVRRHYGTPPTYERTCGCGGYVPEPWPLVVDLIGHEATRGVERAVGAIPVPRAQRIAA